MRRVPLVLAVLLALSTQAFATWPVIAVQAADARGDKRSTCYTLPDPPASCDHKTAHVAYIVVAGRNDKMGSGFNDGEYLMQIEVTGKNIQPGENDNPVKTLRMPYEPWRRSKSGGRVSGL